MCKMGEDEIKKTLGVRHFRVLRAIVETMEVDGSRIRSIQMFIENIYLKSYTYDQLHKIIERLVYWSLVSQRGMTPEKRGHNVLTTVYTKAHDDATNWGKYLRQSTSPNVFRQKRGPGYPASF